MSARPVMEVIRLDVCVQVGIATEDFDPRQHVPVDVWEGQALEIELVDGTIRLATLGELQRDGVPADRLRALALNEGDDVELSDPPTDPDIAAPAAEGHIDLEILTDPQAIAAAMEDTVEDAALVPPAPPPTPPPPAPRGRGRKTPASAG